MSELGCMHAKVRASVCVCVSNPPLKNTTDRKAMMSGG